MKLGLASNTHSRTPAVLVLGEGALAFQIVDDLRELGLRALLVSDLPMLSPQDREVPKVTDLDAKHRFAEIFRAFIHLNKSEPYDHAWVHPGVTVWGERAEFESWARAAKLSAIVSPAKCLHLFWHTHQLMSTAVRIGVPTLMLSDEPVTSAREIEASIKKLHGQKQATLPFVLKSAYRARGGYAVRVIRQLQDLSEWVPVWMNQLRESTGSALLFIERYLEGARCYVQPFARLKTGEIEFFPVIDASLSFEHRNWVEVCPAQSLDEYLQAKIETYSKSILDESEFVGVGNLVFLSNGVEVYLTEGLARPNFAYRLWEKVARTKALQWQLHALAPGLLTETPKARSKIKMASPICGLNLKLYTEDTALKIPHPGQVHELSQTTDWNEGNFEAHLDWDVQPAQSIDWKSTGALGHLTVFSDSWPHLLKATRKALGEIWVSGSLQTNERFLAELLAHPWVEESMFYTGFVDEEFIPKHVPDLEWLQHISNALAEVTPELNEKESWLWMNHRLPPPNGALTWNQRLDVENNGQKGVKGFFRNSQNAPERIAVFPQSASRYVVRIRNWFFSMRRSEKGRPLQLMALTSGRVHSVFFKEGAVVEPRQCVLIIESQQSLISHKLPIHVKLKTLRVKADDEVVLGQELAELERWSDT
jgi:biotin carboxylase/biotin carboxyl carrier protein